MCFWHTAQRLIRLTTDGPLVIPEGTIPGLPGVSSAAPAANTAEIRPLTFLRTRERRPQFPATR